MKSLPWYLNLAGEILTCGCYMLGMVVVAEWAGEKLPAWSFFLACGLGILSWSRPHYSRIKDFYDE